MIKVNQLIRHIFQRRPRVCVDPQNSYCLPIISHASDLGNSS
uniref:Uncharacterized protein n=1 Tax=Setaria italica TaxID=4555 RepID=K3XUI3_SETIT